VDKQNATGTGQGWIRSIPWERGRVDGESHEESLCPEDGGKDQSSDQKVKIDWDKESGKWNIREIETDNLICRVSSVRLLAPSELVSTDGMRHGYLVTAGKLSVSDNVAIILKG